MTHTLITVGKAAIALALGVVGVLLIGEKVLEALEDSIEEGDGE